MHSVLGAGAAAGHGEVIGGRVVVRHVAPAHGSRLQSAEFLQGGHSIRGDRGQTQFHLWKGFYLRSKLFMIRAKSAQQEYSETQWLHAVL